MEKEILFSKISKSSEDNDLSFARSYRRPCSTVINIIKILKNFLTHAHLFQFRPLENCRFSAKPKCHTFKSSTSSTFLTLNFDGKWGENSTAPLPVFRWKFPCTAKMASKCIAILLNNIDFSGAAFLESGKATGKLPFKCSENCAALETVFPLSKYFFDGANFATQISSVVQSVESFRYFIKPSLGQNESSCWLLEIYFSHSMAVTIWEDWLEWKCNFRVKKHNC